MRERKEEKKIQHKKALPRAMLALPSNAEGPFKVKTVVDGDTFNLHDGTRVRVLGVDTPEIKAKALFAQEAKEFAASLIAKKEVFIVYGAEKTDRYGRHLALVYVRSGNGFRCLNTELLEQGLAFYYCPTPGAIPIESDLLAAQKAARQRRANIWATFSDYDCYATRNGRAFHDAQCDFVAGKRSEKMKASEALDRGLSPCRSCLNPDGVHGTTPNTVSGGCATNTGGSNNINNNNNSLNSNENPSYGNHHPQGEPQQTHHPVQRPQINTNEESRPNRADQKSGIPCCTIM